MKAKALALQRRRAALVAQLDVERDLLAYQSAALVPVAHMIDRVGKGIRYIKKHRYAVLIPVVVLGFLRPRRLLVYAITRIVLRRRQ